MLISLPPVITKGEAKTTLFPWYVYPPVEPFVARMLAGTVGRTATFFLSLCNDPAVPAQLSGFGIGLRRCFHL